ncbi:endonuclease/exonuclease/phosphatase family protein [Sinomicrobium weinanense]|uniref:Endonuclease/exonuclease/phosphatase family protein n=1 Tax=Sinomicrobium weinanense TaxID=2842200 RepID=A0A926JTL2_9FLAO|nr:endonuclease/exonuclease/phosphatase family protein [Sinomicrobium weinanense]MBC9797134.1 endonuclease/exonuclease/phosphatase family protein [Sinomicrobium weinanense]MBU3124835.1 endonuclease/exonuclease/phosphatase family protein [Sinomicrobium weinanense]
MKQKVQRNYYLAILWVLCSFCTVYAQSLNVASYNLRYDNPSDSLDNWKFRKETVAKLIRFHDFDIFGSQEGLQHQLNQLKTELPGYDFIGVGRDDGKQKGEHSAIFYKTASLSVLEQGDFWLSPDPAYPNKGWDAVLPRICSWGRFRVKDTGFEFYFFNVHFDHVGTVARKESARLILKKIKELAGEIPVVLTGDFNVDQNSPSYKILNASEQLTDTYDLALLKYGAEGTYNGFDPNSTTTSRIDHVFVSPGFKVKKHGVLTDSYKIRGESLEQLVNSGNYPKEIKLYGNKIRLPSDHYPVMVVVTYNK